MNADVLKKQHFWILAGVAPFLALLAWILIVTGVGGEIEAKSATIKTDLETVSKTRPKGTRFEKDFAEQKKVVGLKREELWKKNYDEQKKLFNWPSNNPTIKALEKKFTKFGEPIKADSTDFELFKRSNIYLAAYEDLVNSMKPVRFQGGWQNCLRHVSDWGTKNPTDKQIWLALEDLWVQRGLLEPIKVVNQDAASFRMEMDPQTGKEPKDPVNRSFSTKLWKLDLQVTDNGPNKSKVIECKLTNKTDRLLPLGSGGAMRLRVWLGDPEREQPIEYRIQGLFVKGNGVVEIRSAFPDDKTDPVRAKAKRDGELMEVKVNPILHGVPVTNSVDKIYRVEQVLDERTIPIQRIETIELGYKDSRHVTASLVGPEWWKAPEVLPTGGGSDVGGGEGGPGPGLSGAGSGAGSGSGVGPSGPGMGGGMGARAKRGGPVAVLDGNRERYLTVTGQVRRMPVAIVLLVDQMYMQETLIAYTNAALRFQITQVHWNRFRRTLGPSSDTGFSGGSEFGMGGPGAGIGIPGSMPGAMPGAMPGSMPGAMPGMAMGGEGEGSVPGIPSIPGMSGFGGFGGFGANSTATEGQLTAGLVELSIYGIITLYEKYENKDETPTSGETTAEPPAPVPAPMNTPMPMTPTPMATPPMVSPAPMPMTPMPMNPAPQPMTPMNPTPATNPMPPMNPATPTPPTAKGPANPPAPTPDSKKN